MAASVPIVNTIAFDCLDPDRLAAFWGALLGVEVRFREDQFVWLGRQREGAYSLMFQRVPDPTPGKNKLHLDCYLEDLPGTTERVVSLGGSVVATHQSAGFVWNVFADPEHNLFCVGHETVADD
jgi:predicted enzyme related to lactoylglutathione lyase